MLGRFPLDRLVWDDWNRAHIARHGVEPNEVEEAVAGTTLAEPSYKGRFALIGVTAAGRFIVSVVGAAPEQPSVYYVFTARPANRRERWRYATAAGNP